MPNPPSIIAASGLQDIHKAMSSNSKSANPQSMKISQISVDLPSLYLSSTASMMDSFPTSSAGAECASVEHEYFSTLDFDFTEDERSLPTLDFDFIEDKGSLPTLDFDFAEDKGSLPQKSEMFRGISDDLESFSSLPFLFEETATSSNSKPKKRARSVSFSDTVTVYEVPPTPRKMFYSKIEFASFKLRRWLRMYETLDPRYPHWDALVNDSDDATADAADDDDNDHSDDFLLSIL